jgi:hypothetical protein
MNPRKRNLVKPHPSNLRARPANPRVPGAGVLFGMVVTTEGVYFCGRRFEHVQPAQLILRVNCLLNALENGIIKSEVSKH